MDGVVPDLFLATTRWNCNEELDGSVLHVVAREGVPLNCEVQFIKGADPSQGLTAEARVIDTQGRIARVAVEVKQGDTMISKLTEMVFLRKVD